MSKSVTYVSTDNPGLFVYNPYTGRLLCQFVDGKFTTDDPIAIKILDVVKEVLREGVERPDETSVEKTLQEISELPSPVEEMTVKQLHAHAKENEIEVPKSAKTRDAILAVVIEGLENQVE